MFGIGSAVKRFVKVAGAEVLKNGKTALGYGLEQAFTSDPGLLAAYHALAANPSKENVGYFLLHGLLVVGSMHRGVKVILDVLTELKPVKKYL